MFKYNSAHTRRARSITNYFDHTIVHIPVELDLWPITLTIRGWNTSYYPHCHQIWPNKYLVRVGRCNLQELQQTPSKKWRNVPIQSLATIKYIMPFLKALHQSRRGYTTYWNIIIKIVKMTILAVKWINIYGTQN